MKSGTKRNNLEEPFSPLVSIIIPVFNGSNYLAEAIESAIEQTYENCEILVINDGSQDGGKTEKIAKDYEKQGLIRYFDKPNGGCGSALNVGLKHMEGGYFSWLSHDDLYKPNKIKHQVELLSQLENKQTIIYGGYELIDSKGTKISEVDAYKHVPLSKREVALYPLLCGYIHGCSLLIPKECFDNLGLFNESLLCTQDYDLWFKFLRKYPLYNDKKLLTLGRIHDERTTHTSDRVIEECDDLWIGFLTKLSKAEKEAVFNTESAFYTRMYEHLITTPYQGAIAEAEKLKQKAIHETEITVIVVYEDAEEELQKTIKSIKEQTHQNFEIIILDVYSKLEKSNWSKVATLKAVKNIRISKAINDAIKTAKGEYIAFIECGNIFDSCKLEKQLYHMLCNNESMLSYSNFLQETITKQSHLKSSKNNRNKLLYDKFPEIICNSQIQPSTLMFHKNLIDIATLPEEFEEGAVRCFIIESASRCKTIYLSKALTTIKEQESDRLLYKEKKIKALLNILTYLNNHRTMQYCYNEFNGLACELRDLLKDSGYDNNYNQINSQKNKRIIALLKYFYAHLKVYGLSKTLYVTYEWFKKKFKKEV